jgi:hypothetical protein
VLGEDERFDIATHIKVSDHPHPAWGEQGDQVVKDHVGRRLVADLPLAILVDIEFQTLQFDNLLIWHIVNADRGKIRKA